MEARGLAAKDRGGTSDPYFLLRAEKPKGTNNWEYVQLLTKAKKKTLNPKWGTEGKLSLNGVTRSQLKAGDYKHKPVVVDLFDWNFIQKDEFMGRATIDISDVLKSNNDTLEIWVPLTARPEGEPAFNKKEKSRKGPDKGVSGELRVLLVLDDLNIQQEELERYQKQLKLTTTKIQEMYAVFREKGQGQEVKSVGELVEIFKKTQVLETCLTRWSGADITRSQNWKVMREDKECMYLVFRQFFDAFDTDHSGTISFEELVVGLNFLTEGTKEDVLRLHFKSYDINKDGNLTREEAGRLTRLTVALIRAGFMVCLRAKKDEMLKCGLKEQDFLPILDAITNAFEKHDLASIETDLLFKVRVFPSLFDFGLSYSFAL